MHQLTLDQITNDKSFKKAKSLCDKYQIETFDDFAKRNMDEIRELQKQFG